MAVPLDPTLHDFASGEIGDYAALVRCLGNGHEPIAVMITCSHLGLAPDQMSHAAAGQVSIIQHVANTVPPPEPGRKRSELASLCWALEPKTVRHVIICGHAACGCVQRAVAAPPDDAARRSMCGLEKVRALVGDRYAHLDEADRFDVATRENVLIQLENLRRHEFIRRSIRTGRLALHGWLVCDETAMVRYFDPATRQFELPTGRRLAHPHC